MASASSFLCAAACIPHHFHSSPPSRAIIGLRTRHGFRTRIVPSSGTRPLHCATGPIRSPSPLTPRGGSSCSDGGDDAVLSSGGGDDHLSVAAVGGSRRGGSGGQGGKPGGGDGEDASDDAVLSSGGGDDHPSAAAVGGGGRGGSEGQGAKPGGGDGDDAYIELQVRPPPKEKRRKRDADNPLDLEAARVLEAHQKNSILQMLLKLAVPVPEIKILEEMNAGHLGDDESEMSDSNLGPQV